MTKEEFIQFLHEPEIQQEILCVISEDKSRSDNECINEKVLVNDKHLDLINELSSELQRAKNIIIQERKRAQLAEDELDKCRTLLDQMNEALTKANEKVEILRDNEVGLRDELKDLREAEKKLRQENQHNSQRKESLEKANHKLQMQLEQRFARGWELFEQYRNVSSYTKESLHDGVFVNEDSFMSFICGIAQTSSLERLWEVLSECIMNGRKEDAVILWEIFEYAIELVNSTKIEARYEILLVNEGDRFDSDIHRGAPGSLAQGNVCIVYLPGYKNTYGNKIIRKSIVQVA